MQGAEEIDLSGGFTTTERAALRNKLREEPGALPSRMRFVIASLVLQTTLLGVIASAGYVLIQRTHRLDRDAQNQATQAAAVVQKVDALSAQSELTKVEVANLHKTLASTTSEDVLFLKIILLKPDVDLQLARTIARDVHQYSLLYGRDPNLVLAIIAVESRFDSKAISPVGAVGLMQVMPHWKKVLGITGDLTDPEVSIKYGLQVLGFYEEMYKDLEVVLTAYNRGPGPVDKALMKGTSPMNNYAPLVLQTYERLKRLNVQSAR
jgi:soluble lytic murein transglycosylase-like protein